jgi:hypothetical protein
MSSFPDRINELIRLLSNSASAVNSRQGDRVYNFHYSPGEWTQFRQHLPQILNRMRDQGFTPNVYSFADICLKILKESPIYAAQIKMESMGNFPHRQRNQALYGILAGTQGGQPLSMKSPIVAALDQAIQDTATINRGVLFLKDTETIHPLFRISAFEQILQGKFIVPTVICYPGEKGNIGDNPSFLGFYQADGNYRSTHIY